MNNQFKDHDARDAPSPERPQEGAIWRDRGVKYVWHNGGWWQPATLPWPVYYEHLTREYERDRASMSTPRP